LEETLRPIEILQLEGPQIAYPSIRRKLVLDQLPRRVGEQHLAAVTRRADPRCPVHTKAHVPLTGRTWFSRMHSHSHPNLDTLRPTMPGKSALSLGRARNRITSAAIRDEERVALRVDLPPFVGGEALAENPLVICENRLVTLTKLFEKPGRALDVREEEGDGARRQCRDHKSFRRV
jgi:hypothetical protein